MSELSTSTLFDVGRTYWRVFAPAWAFPFVFLYGGVAADAFDYGALFFWLVAMPLFFWSFGRATRPWFRQEAGYWHIVFWAMVVPFMLWGFAVFSRLALLHVLGGAA